MIEQHRLYLNDTLIELESESKQFARTLQVNDLVSLDNRQTNYTKNIKIPKTPKNVLTFDFLGVVGNDSNLPYQKNYVKYYVGNEAIIYNGFAVITETNDFYNLTVYDGNIDLYKSIENTTLGDLNLSEITHTKDVTTIKNSWLVDGNYKYIVADYNGIITYSGTNGTTLNMDYLVPSVKVSYLWNKLFDKYGYTYSGSVFSSEDFTNLWLTYPKGVSFATVPTLIGQFAAGPLNKIGWARHMIDSTGISSPVASIFSETSKTNTGYGTNDEHIKALETKVFNVTITGKIHPISSANANATEVPVELLLIKNCTGISVNNASNLPHTVLATNLTSASTVNINFDFTLNANETFSIVERNVGPLNTHILASATNLVIKVSYYDSKVIDFGSLLTDFSTKNFINEILQRFGLNIYKDKYTNNYSFLTLSEILQTTNIVDWSDKFQSVTSEKYIYGSYGQFNHLKYKYNDIENTHNNGTINIDNKNIAESKTVIESTIYSPSKETTAIPYLNLTDVNNYQLWQKEPKEDGTINYKELDKRYYFVRSINKNYTSDKFLGSKQLGLAPVTFTTTAIENFNGLSFDSIITKYYLPIYQILNKSKIVTAYINLNYNDISEFDFTKLYYIKQLGNYYLINKIIDFQIGEVTKVEMIKVNYALESGPTLPPDNVPQFKTITVTPRNDSVNLIFFVDIVLENGYTNLVGMGTSITFNNRTTGFISFYNLSGNTYRLTSLDEPSTDGSMNLNNIVLIFTNNTNNVTYYSRGNNTLSFTAAEVTAGTSKTLNLQIT